MVSVLKDLGKEHPARKLLESLDQNAKTLSDLLWENNFEWNEWLRMGVTEAKQIALAPKYQGKWVSVEGVTAL